MFSQLPLLMFTMLMAAAALSDARSLTIPNRLTAAVAVLYLPHALLVLDLPQAGAGLLVGGLMMMFGFLMFVAGAFGGGDAKLLAATSLWAGPALLLDYLMVVAVAGGILAAALLVAPVARAATALRGAAPGAGRTPVPYGIALGCGGLAVAAQLGGWA